MTDDSYRSDRTPTIGAQRWNTGGASDYADKAKSSLSRDAGNVREQLVGGFGRVVDAAEGQLHRVPANFQPAARKAVTFSRERPLATMAGLAALALVLTSGARRR